MYLSLQALRGVAVLMVVCKHAGLSVFGATLGIVPLAAEGFLGVLLFFAISGFIIADRIGTSHNYALFVARRYLRIWPLYALATVLALELTLFTGTAYLTAPRTTSGAPFEPGPFYILKSILILPQDPAPLVSVGWSLENELVFYAVFGAVWFAGGPRAARWAAVAASVGLGLLALVGGVAEAALYLYFCAGVLAQAWSASGRATRIAGPLALLGFGLAVGLWHLDPRESFALPTPWHHVAQAAGACGLLVWVRALEGRGEAFTRRSWLTWTGDISYSLYLVHVIVIGPAILVSAELEPSPVAALAAILALVAASFAAAALVHRWVEAPMHRLVQRRIRRLPTPPAAR